MTRRKFLAGIVAPLASLSSIEWIGLDLTGQVRSMQWPGADRNISFGSLLKPFLVLGYGATHSDFPVVDCRGTASHCWNPRGHGSQNVVAALANSCNTYFLRLSAALNRAALDRVCLSYGLTAPDRSDDPARLIGLGDGWLQTPMQVARAFAHLAQNSDAPDVTIALDGMARCASVGTGKAVDMRCYAKTGTARCAHHRGLGDGYTVAIFSLDDPRHVLLVGEHNTTGASAARNLKALAKLIA